MKLIAKAVGLVMIAGGLAKLTRPAAYEALVDDLDWSADERGALGAAEVLGGLLMLWGPTHRLGSGVVLAASGAALTMETRSGVTELAAPRAGVILAALLTTLV